jgi:hypothetical protein
MKWFKYFRSRFSSKLQIKSISNKCNGHNPIRPNHSKFTNRRCSSKHIQMCLSRQLCLNTWWLHQISNSKLFNNRSPNLLKDRHHCKCRTPHLHPHRVISTSSHTHNHNLTNLSPINLITLTRMETKDLNHSIKTNSN